MTKNERPDLRDKKATSYDDLKKVLSGDVSNTPCTNSATGCSHHK